MPASCVPSQRKLPVNIPIPQIGPVHTPSTPNPHENWIKSERLSFVVPPAVWITNHNVQALITRKSGWQRCSLRSTRGKQGHVWTREGPKHYHMSCSICAFMTHSYSILFFLGCVFWPHMPTVLMIRHFTQTCSSSAELSWCWHYTLQYPCVCNRCHVIILW